MISDFEQRVLSHIDDSELIDWVQQLTRIPSVWRPEIGVGEAEAALWVEARCKEIGLETHVEFPHPTRPNVIGLLRCGASAPTPPSPMHGGGSQTLMFEGHTDVVTEGDAAQWSDPPFSATIRDGRIYGRGANDMKAGLVCALVALKALVRSRVALKGDVLLGALCDEEGQMLGVKHFVT